MTKEQLIDLVDIRVNGGELTTDSAVWREDIAAYLPAAVNFAVTKSYYTQDQDEGDREFPSSFYGFFGPLTVQEDQVRNRRYVDLPAQVIALPRNRGLRTVEDACGNTLFPLPDAAMFNLKDYLCLTPEVGYYRLEGKKVYVFNLDALMDQLFLVQIVAVGDLKDTDELPIPAGLETDVVDLCVAFMTGERQIPADRQNDGRDLN